ncbi:MULTISPECIES: hypothetical protein [unclassified Bradyrhizobium]|uniref:hypothetical protein n=1 Tax=unclassified Bradyrhizobium TaxID=2631580 RepID=UPI0028EB8695|nr:MULTISPECIES: hypothetical protein [unclassified Bradyrhizobium]
MTSHQKRVSPGAGDTARGAKAIAHDGRHADGHLTKKPDAEHQQKLRATFEPCRSAHEEARRHDEETLKAARLVAVELGFAEVGLGRFEAVCPECEAFVSFGCDGVVEDNPRGSCKALPSIRARVKCAFDGGGR